MARFLIKIHALQTIMGSPDYGLENEQKLHFFLALGQTSLSVILKIFLTFERSEPGDSYKLDSYKKKCVVGGDSFSRLKR